MANKKSNKMTKIFKSYVEFLERNDLELNGVSEDFATAHPNFEKENETNRGCWNCSDCSDCSRCSRCSGCSGCSDCSRCSRCSGCVSVARLNKKNNFSAKPLEKGDSPDFPDVPIINNIHQKVFEAASKKDALNMGNWHTCKTTHCRAGWVVTLAGEEGKNLEKITSPIFAAMQIYKKSSPIRVYPPRFFDDNQKALEDMKRCAEEERMA